MQSLMEYWDSPEWLARYHVWLIVRELQRRKRPSMLVISHYQDPGDNAVAFVSVRVGRQASDGRILAREERITPAEALEKAAELISAANKVEALNAGRHPESTPV
jgi:hypothetical protein